MDPSGKEVFIGGRDDRYRGRFELWLAKYSPDITFSFTPLPSGGIVVDAKNSTKENLAKLKKNLAEDFNQEFADAFVSSLNSDSKNLLVTPQRSKSSPWWGINYQKAKVRSEYESLFIEGLRNRKIQIDKTFDKDMVLAYFDGLAP